MSGKRRDIRPGGWWAALTAALLSAFLLLPPEPVSAVARSSDLRALSKLARDYFGAVEAEDLTRLEGIVAGPTPEDTARVIAWHRAAFAATDVRVRDLRVDKVEVLEGGDGAMVTVTVASVVSSADGSESFANEITYVLLCRPGPAGAWRIARVVRQEDIGNILKVYYLKKFEGAAKASASTIRPAETPHEAEPPPPAPATAGRDRAEAGSARPPNPPGPSVEVGLFDPAAPSKALDGKALSDRSKALGLRLSFGQGCDGTVLLRIRVADQGRGKDLYQIPVLAGKAGASTVVTLRPPMYGWLPGRYRVTVESQEGGVLAAGSFRVVQ